MQYIASHELNVAARPLGKRVIILAAISSLVSYGGALSAVAAQEQPARRAAQQPEEAASRPGLAALVRVNLPVTSGADAPLKLTLNRARDQLLAEARQRGDGRRPILVLRIAPASNAEGAGAGSQFETALSLARFLTSREMADVRTVAWVPRSIRGHGVLVAIACEEIVMAADAEIGEAGVDEPDQAAIGRTVIEAYREIADAKRTLPVQLAQSMIDPSIEVVQVQSEEGYHFLFANEVADFRKDHEVINEEKVKPAGSFGRYSGRDGRQQFGFVKYLADDRAGIAKALGVPVDALQENQALLADWQPIMLEVRGKVTPSSVSQFKTLLGNHLGGGANWIGVRIDSVGGDLAACIDLASSLAELDPNSVRTVAYVPVEARGGAALIALACDQIVMHPEATIGVGPEATIPQARDDRRLPRIGPRPRRDEEDDDEDFNDPAEIAGAVSTVRDSLAKRAGRPWSLMAAMIDPGVEVYAHRNRATGEERLMSAEEAADLADAANWARGAPLHVNNQVLALSGAQAVQSGLAFQTVDNFDQLKRLYSLQDIPVVEANWALRLVHALASDSIATFLLLLGLIGMYIELKTPGVGVGGVVAAIAFILFFWSKFLDQTATELEIILFVAGVVLMLIEIFVVPGVGVFGLAGGLMVISSLILASQTFIVPRSEADLNELRRSITVVVAAGMAMIGLAFATRRYLPKAPIFNRLVLEPPPLEERITLSHREALADYSHLVGVSGEAVTDLRPAGRALIGDQLIDVIAEGVPLDRGTPVVVVAAHAHRVLVRAAT
jgi:membrane-bound serine protease (ClpP class)